MILDANGRAPKASSNNNRIKGLLFEIDQIKESITGLHELLIKASEMLSNFEDRIERLENE